MTPSPRARKVATAILEAVPRGMFTANEVYLREAISRALDAERERCLKIAESARIPDTGNTSTQTLWMNEAAGEIAAAIRALADEEAP